MAERISLQTAAITMAQLAPITIKAVVQLHKQMPVSHAALTGWAMDELLLDEGGNADCVNPEHLLCVWYSARVGTGVWAVIDQIPPCRSWRSHSLSVGTGASRIPLFGTVC